jgi:hypothetical protein
VDRCTPSLTFVKQKSTLTAMKDRKPQIGRPPIAPDTAFCALRLSGSIVAQVDRWARRKGVTRSEMLRQLIATGLQRERGKR